MDERSPTAHTSDELDRQNFLQVLGSIVGRLARDAVKVEVAEREQTKVNHDAA
jgi:hypothetical protein